jgi:hypothetical protein
MSDSIKHLDLDSEDFEDAPKALRDYARNLKKQYEQAVSERDGVRKQLASKAVSEVLGDKGFKNPKRVERDLLADGIDPLDTSAVDAWLEENSDDYARTDGSAAPAPVQPDPAAAQQAAAYQQLNAGGELRAPADLSKWELAQSEITPNMTGAEVAAVYAKHGI